MQETLLTINLQQIQQNASRFKHYTDRFLYAVVKADAYGHGAVRVTDALQMVADGFAVALIDEAIAIKTAAAGKEILVFTPPVSELDVVIAATNGFTLTAAGLQSARLIVDTLCTRSPTFSISGATVPRSEVHRRFLELDQMDICYVHDQLKKETQEIRYLRSYILARLYEAKNLSDIFYSRWADRDLNKPPTGVALS